MSNHRVAGRLAAIAIFLTSSASFADPVSDFYRAKEMAIVVGSAPGGGYDTTARLLARHYSKHIPGHPSIIIRNMPGAGSLNMTNHVANVAPKDGTTIGAPQNTAPLEKLLHILSPGGKNASFNAEKLQWLGTTAQDTFVLITWHTAPAKTFEDLKKVETLVGSTGHNTDQSITARLLNQVFGTKLKIVTGYKSSPEIMLAMERGELQGSSGRAYSSLMSGSADVINDGKALILIQMGMTKHPDIPNVPFALDLATSDVDRKVLELVFSKYQMSRPFFVPAETPPERVTALRRAFDATMKDPAFLEDAKRQQMEIAPLRGEEVQKLIEQLFKTPEPLLERARALLKPPAE